MNERFEGATPRDEIDRRMQQFAIEAQQHPPQSSQRQQALNQLINEILQSNLLSHPQSGTWPPSVYQDLYNEARQRTLLDICQKIANYRPENPVIAWVNTMLKYNFIAVVNEQRGGRIIYLPSLDELDASISLDTPVEDSQMLRQFLEEDPENLLKAEFIRGRPEITFQVLALARYVEEKSWDKLSKDLDIPVQTLCSFFNRKLRNFMSYFHRYLQE